MDRQVIELLRTKDEEGIRLLQKQYANLLYYIVYPILQSKEETEECLSDIYFLVWDRFEQFDEAIVLQKILLSAADETNCCGAWNDGARRGGKIVSSS